MALKARVHCQQGAGIFSSPPLNDPLYTPQFLNIVLGVLILGQCSCFFYRRPQFLFSVKRSNILRSLWSFSTFPRKFWVRILSYLKNSSFYIKGKGEVVPVLLIDHHAMKLYWGSGGITPCIHDVGTRWR